MPQPTIAPTTEGNIVFEWYFDGVGASGEIILSNGMMWFSCHDGEPGNEGYEEMIDMTRKGGWERLAALLEARPTHCNYVNLANT